MTGKKKKKKKYPKLETQERPRHELQTFKVRCSLETAFYIFVEAHDSAEAEIVAKNWCKENEADPDGFLLWDSEASYKKHSTFEAEET